MKATKSIATTFLPLHCAVDLQSHDEGSRCEELHYTLPHCKWISVNCSIVNFPSMNHLAVCGNVALNCSVPGQIVWGSFVYGLLVPQHIIPSPKRHGDSDMVVYWENELCIL